MYGGVEEEGAGGGVNVKRCRFHSLGDDVSFDDAGHRRRGRRPVSILNFCKKKKKKYTLMSLRLVRNAAARPNDPKVFVDHLNVTAASADSREVLPFSERSG